MGVEDEPRGMHSHERTGWRHPKGIIGTEDRVHTEFEWYFLTLSSKHLWLKGPDCVPHPPMTPKSKSFMKMNS